EPKEVLIEAAVPNGLMNVSNGRFVGKKDLGNGYTRWSWKVNSPINNYNIVLNIANYAHFSDTYKSAGHNDLDLDYYVLPYNLDPKEVLIEAAVPNGLMNVSNGRFVGKKDLGNGYTRWSWKVNSPINNYNIVLNIANYAHFSDTYKSAGHNDLDLDYYVLPYN